MKFLLIILLLSALGAVIVDHSTSRIAIYNPYNINLKLQLKCNWQDDGWEINKLYRLRKIAPFWLSQMILIVKYGQVLDKEIK